MKRLIDVPTARREEWRKEESLFCPYCGRQGIWVSDSSYLLEMDWKEGPDWNPNDCLCPHCKTFFEYPKQQEPYSAEKGGCLQLTKESIDFRLAAFH